MSKFYFYSALIFAFSLPLSRAIISALVVLLPLVWLFDGNLRAKYHAIRSNPVLLSIALYLGYMLLSLLWTTDITEGLNTARLYMYWLLIFVFATRLQKEHIEPLLTAFLAGMFVSEVIAYGVFFDLWTFKNMTKEYLSPFMMHIDYSVFLAFTSVLLMSRILSKKYSIQQKLVFGFFLCTVTGNLFLAPGRTGQLAFIVGVMVIFIYHYEFKVQTLLKAIATIGLVLVLAYNVSNVFQERLNELKKDMAMLQSGDFNGSWGTRVAFILTSIEILKNHPLIGTGLGGSIDAAKSVFDTHQINFDASVESFITNNHFHNQFLMIFVELGLIGMVLSLNLIARLFNNIRHMNAAYKEIMVIFLIIYLVSCIAEPLWMKQFTIGLWVFVLGCLIVAIEQEKKEQNGL